MENFEDVRDNVWKYINEKRFKGYTEFKCFAETVKEVQPDISYSDFGLLVADYNKRMGKSCEPLFIPEAFKWFIREFAAKVLPSNALVPVATGSECNLLEKNTDIIYHFVNKELEEAVKLFINITTIDEIPNDGRFDLIFSSLPLGSINAQSFSNQVVENCARILAPGGYAIFTFAKAIAFQSSKKWLSELEGKGLYCNAIIDMPIGAYAPISMVDSEIVIFSKNESEILFIGLLEEESLAEQLVDNFLNGNESKSGTKLGIYASGDVRCYSDFLNVYRIHNKNKALSKAYNGDSIMLSLLGKIRTPDKNNKFEEIEGAVYVPKLGNSPVVTDSSEFYIKPQNYFQVVLNTDMMVPRFLAFLLNTEEGINLRQLSYKGVTIKAFNSKTLGDMEIPCPSVELQLEYLRTYDQLEMLRVEVESLKNKLQKTPAAYKNIRKEIKDINNNGDKFAQWIESLPYPIATILKRYSVADDPKSQQEALLFFFEAYAIFEAALLSAAINNNKDLVDCASLSEVDSTCFEKASFGNWVKMDRVLSKMFLSSVTSSDEANKKVVLKCFKTADENLVKLLCNKNVCNILEQSSKYRNLWKGHSGITSEALYMEQVDLLKSQLYKLQDSIKDLYEKIRLIRPISLSLSNGVFSNKVEVLTGSNPLFVKETINSHTALDNSKLYIQLIDTGEMLDLPPYFILKNSPADVKNACYFYSRIESGNTRYVSYHYDGKPEDMENGEAAFQHIKDMLSN